MSKETAGKAWDQTKLSRVSSTGIFVSGYTTCNGGPALSSTLQNIENFPFSPTSFRVFQSILFPNSFPKGLEYERDGKSLGIGFVVFKRMGFSA